jgi:hypothetical protein
VGEIKAPLLADAYPALVTYLEAALIAEDSWQSLARVVHELRFYGWCRCKPSCTYLLTGAEDDRDNAWIDLEGDDEEPTVWLQLNRGHTSFAGMEILEFDLGPVTRGHARRPPKR